MSKLLPSSRSFLRRVLRCIPCRSFSASALSSTTSSSSPPPSSHDNNSSDDDKKQTHFGFRDVPISEKQRLVSSVFSSVAPSYDLMNDLMSVRVHRLWKDAFVNDMAPTGQMRILDCAGGTGDIAFRIADYVNRNDRHGWSTSSSSQTGITVCDINEGMLSVGQTRASKFGHSKDVSFIHGDAEKLPFEDNSFDVYAISFGMRNVPRPEVALKEALRVLKPGGRFMMLEFAKVNSNALPVSQLYDAWSFRVIPAIGKYIARDEEAYQYLVESIRRFPAQSQFLTLVEEAGFAAATATDYSFGIAACYSAFNPGHFGNSSNTKER